MPLISRQWHHLLMDCDCNSWQREIAIMRINTSIHQISHFPLVYPVMQYVPQNRNGSIKFIVSMTGYGKARCKRGSFMNNISLVVMRTHKSNSYIRSAGTKCMQSGARCQVIVEDIMSGNVSYSNGERNRL